MAVVRKAVKNCLFALVYLLLFNLTYATYEYSVFEELEIPETWRKSHRLDPAAVLPIKVALTQRNLDRAEDFIMDVSDPHSQNYGEFWSMEKVYKTFAPSAETINAVRNWLITEGIAANRITLSEDKGWLYFDTHAKEAEHLFRAQYYHFNHISGGEDIASETYSIPDVLKEYIDFVTPGVMHSRLIQNAELSEPASHRKSNPVQDRHCLDSNLTCCDILIHPGCIRALYQLPKRSDSQQHSLQAGNHLAIYGGAYKDTRHDLNMFFKRYASFIPKGTYPRIRRLTNITQLGKPNGEAALDWDVAYPIVYPQIIESLQGKQPPEHIFHKGEQPPYVIVTTYTQYYETGPKSKKHAMRSCNGYMKLSLMGSSIMTSSGDIGVGHKFATQKPFTGEIPAVCPFITSVGGTEVKRGRSVNDPEIAARQDHLFYTSGGGFSQLFKSPKYQKSAVANYFAKHDPGIKYYNGTNEYPTRKQTGGPKYNRLGRGYPDVAANGKNAVIAAYNKYSKLSGTSASAPIFASIINIIVEERLNAGKKPLGFLNPAIYQNPDMFNDITEGYNAGAGFQKAFKAVKGWDPVTGLGTPNYPEMRKYFMNL